MSRKNESTNALTRDLNHCSVGYHGRGDFRDQVCWETLFFNVLLLNQLRWCFSFVTRHRNLKLTASSKTTNKVYGEDTAEYGEDVDKLLVKLTQEELEELNDDVDPDVSSENS